MMRLAERVIGDINCNTPSSLLYVKLIRSLVRLNQQYNYNIMTFL